MKGSERNAKAHEFFKAGEIDKAIELYEMNVQLKHEGAIAYNRLITIYSKNNDVQNELRVLKMYLVVAQKLAKECNERIKQQKNEIVEFIQTRINKLSE